MFFIMKLETENQILWHQNNKLGKKRKYWHKGKDPPKYSFLKHKGKNASHSDNVWSLFTELELETRTWTHDIFCS